MIKNVFYNLQQILGSDFVLFYLGKSNDLTREEKNLYEKKTIGVFYARGDYLPFKDTKGLEANGSLVLEIPLGKDEDGLQAALKAFERLVDNTNGEIFHEGQGYNYVFKWQFPVPIGNVENTYGAKRQPYQLNFSLIISNGLLAANEVSVKVDGEDLEGITFWSENSLIQTQEVTTINEFGTRSEGLTRTYVLKLQGLVKDISLWEKLIQEAYDESDNEHYVETTFGQNKSKNFLAVTSNITRTGQVGNFQAYELVFVQSARTVFDLIFNANGGEWEEVDRYSVTYNANGGFGTTTDPDSPYEEGATAVIVANSFTRANYNFVKWNTAQDGSGTDYFPDDEVEITDNLVLYAQWAQIGTLTVSYSANGGDTSIVDSNQYESGSTVTVIFIPKPTKSNSEFIGWATSIKDNPDYAQGGTKTFAITSNVTLYAVWRTVNTITVTFTSEKIIAIASESVTSDLSIGVSYSINGEDDVTVINIDEGETEGEVEIAGVEDILGLSVIPNYDDNYYYKAVSGEITYKTVTYNSNGGTGTMQPQSVPSGSSITLRPNTFTKEGEYFMGWAISDGGTVVYNDSVTISNITESITLYAVWGYQIVFNGNGGQL